MAKMYSWMKPLRVKVNIYGRSVQQLVVGLDVYSRQKLYLGALVTWNKRTFRVVGVGFEGAKLAVHVVAA